MLSGGVKAGDVVMIRGGVNRYDVLGVGTMHLGKDSEVPAVSLQLRGTRYLTFWCPVSEIEPVQNPAAGRPLE